MIPPAEEDAQYEGFLSAVRARFARATESGEPLFGTSAAGLFDAFLEALPAASRQRYTCSACRRFVGRFGRLVTIGEDGATASVMWDPDSAPPLFAAGVRAMERLVIKARITHVFLNGEETWGAPSTTSAKPPFEWRHLAVVPDPKLVYRPTPLQTVGQKIAERIEERRMLGRGLESFPIDVVREAHKLLSTEQLFRSEKHIGAAKWLLDLHEARESARDAAARENLAWRAVGSAPPGFCHVRSGMIGTLLEDIQAGLPFATIKAKFDAKMHPLLYQRPQAAPTEGNLRRAEEIVQKLGLAPSLERRFARLSEVDAIWRPGGGLKDKGSGQGVFGHLRTKESRPTAEVETPPVTMTWEKLARTVLPDAESIEFFSGSDKDSYVALVTAVHADAPPILQWDRPERRNPVSWYVYVNGSRPADWNLKPREWHRVTAITRSPAHWYGDQTAKHQGEACCFLLEGARDLKHKSGGGFFPEWLKSELHEVRRTLEAYAKEAVIADRDEATACGLVLTKGQSWNHLFRVKTKGSTVTYRLDRWD